MCITPAAPSPLPIPYPTMGTVGEGIVDGTMRTKINGSVHATVGSCVKVCHGNEAGTLKEVVSLNTAGPSFLTLGAPTVLVELGMAGITGSLVQMNKAVTVGASGSASDAGGDASGGGGGGGGGGAGDPNGPGGASGGGGGGGGDHQGAAPPNPGAPPGAEGQAHGGHPVDVITGSVFTVPSVDIRFNGPLSFELTRGYATSAVNRHCGFGRGWGHSLHWRAERKGNRITLQDPRLRETTVTLPEEGQVAVLPFGLEIALRGDAIGLLLPDGLFRVLGRVADSSSYVLSQVRDEVGNFIEITWEKNEIVGVVDSVGRTATLHEAALTRAWIVAVVGADGQTSQHTAVTYELDRHGDLVSVIDAGGAETRYAYDDEHYLVSETRPDGVTYRFVYGEAGGRKRCVETWGEIASANVLELLGVSPTGDPPRGIYHTRFRYGPGPFDTVMVDGAGATHEYRGDPLGLVVRYTDPRGHTSQFRYDALGNMTLALDGQGRALRRAIDATGRVVSETHRDGRTSRRIHDDAAARRTGVQPGDARDTALYLGSRVLAKDDESGRVTQFTYDDRGLPTGSTYPDGTSERREYDAHGNLRRHVLPNEASYEYTFDLFGRPVAVKSALGVEYRLEWDGRSDLVRIEEPGGKVTELQRDVAGHVVAAREPNGAVSTYRYVAGRVVEWRRPDGVRFRIGYDALLRLRWLENGAGERYSRVYDASGNVIQETSFAGVVTEYEYDGSNYLVRIGRADGSSIRLMRDGEGRLLEREHSSGAVTRFEYDAGGRLSRAVLGPTTTTFERDARGRVLRESQEIGSWRFAVESKYDGRGQPLTTRYSTGWSVDLRRRPEDGAIAAMAATAAEREEVLFEYDDRGIETARRRADVAGAVRTRSNAYGLPIETTIHGREDDVLRARAYDWAVGGPVQEIRDSKLGRRRFDLDLLGRPQSVAGFGADEAFAFAPQGTPLPAARGWSVGKDGRPLSVEDAHLAWDKLGRLTSRTHSDPTRAWRYVYDDADRLIEAVRSDGLSIRYLYDALGRRILETSGGRSTWFGWDGDSMVEERSTEGTSVQRVFDDTGFVPVLEARNGKDWRLVVADAAGTPWLYVDRALGAAEIELTAWGEVAHALGDAGLLRFAGQRADVATGLHYNNQRYYAPDLHVFLTPDPCGLRGSIQDVGFVPNVTLYVDPLGLTTIVVGAPGDSVIEGSTSRLQERYPGAKVIRADRLGQPPSLWQRIRGQNNMIDPAEDHVIVNTHGAPGEVQFGKSWDPSTNVNGQKLGQRLTQAGFSGGPGRSVDLLACNGATPGPAGQQSVAAGVAATTGSGTNGALAMPGSTPPAMYQPAKPWWKFWGSPAAPQRANPGELWVNGPGAPMAGVAEGGYVGVSPTGRVFGQTY